MRKLDILLLLTVTVPSAFAKNPVTSDMVDQLLISAHGKADAKVAEQLFDLELTERASSARRARWEAELPGPKSRQALLALADASVFLRLPPEEIPGTPGPDRAAQDSLLGLTRNFLTDTILKLPNFFATRSTTRFSDEPEKINSMTLVHSQYQQMHLMDITSDKVYFREGKEVIVDNKNKQVSFSGKALATQGVFGEAMELVLSDVLPSGPVWSHWEGGDDAPLAVFRYAVPLERSHYAVKLTDDPGTTFVRVAYQGEVAIDSANGTVRRWTAVAELSGSSPISKANVMVQYGPVEIGGTSYICPTRSVSLAVMRAINTAPNSQTNADAMPNSQNANTSPNFQNGFSSGHTAAGPPLTKVNDVQFTDYHRFRAESRILTGDDAKPAVTAPASGSAPNSTANP
jgi:hypothetical protein